MQALVLEVVEGAWKDGKALLAVKEIVSGVDLRRAGDRGTFGSFSKTSIQSGIVAYLRYPGNNSACCSPHVSERMKLFV